MNRMNHELYTLVAELLPPLAGLRLIGLTTDTAGLLVELTATARSAPCPLCATASTQVHSRYQRQLADLPWGTRPVRLQLLVRKFFCRNPSCSRLIFTERLPDLVPAYARKTKRLSAAMQAVGLSLGGRAVAAVMGRFSSISPIIGSLISCRIARPTRSPTGWLATRVSPSCVEIEVICMRRAFAAVPPRRSRLSIAFTSSKTCARRWNHS